MYRAFIASRATQKYFLLLPEPSRTTGVSFVHVCRSIKRNRPLPKDDHSVMQSPAAIFQRLRKRPAPPATAAEAEQARRVRRNQRALDWLNFFIADVETGFGPFLAL